MAINVDLVGRLIHAQFPQWADLTVQAVSPGGWDNRTFRLGRHMLVRLPSAEAYAAQLERERRWLPVLAPQLSQPIPEPLAVGEPCFGYPWRWSIYRWLEGDTALPERIVNLDEFARDLSVFLRSLHAVSTQGGPAAGPDTFHRGGSLAVYDGETRQAIAALEPRLNVEAATATWKTALVSRWMREPVWVHGDMGVGNLLVRDGRLSGVVDFGQSCVGDPACDLAPTWTLFDAESGDVFRRGCSLDEATWARGRGWVLWKALIVAARLAPTNAWEGTRCWRTIEAVLADHARTAA